MANEQSNQMIVWKLIVDEWATRIVKWSAAAIVLWNIGVWFWGNVVIKQPELVSIYVIMAIQLFSIEAFRQFVEYNIKQVNGENPPETFITKHAYPILLTTFLIHHVVFVVDVTGSVLSAIRFHSSPSFWTAYLAFPWMALLFLNSVESMVIWFLHSRYLMEMDRNIIQRVSLRIKALESTEGERATQVAVANEMCLD